MGQAERRWPKVSIRISWYTLRVTRHYRNANRSYSIIWDVIVMANDLLSVLWSHVPKTPTVTLFTFVLLTWEFFICIWLSKCHLYLTHIMSFDFWHIFSTDSFELGQEHSEYVSYVHRSHLEAKMGVKKLNSLQTWTEPRVRHLYELIFLSHHNLMYNFSNHIIDDQSIENINLSRSVKWECC
jgi:hypothetical protein